MTRATKYVALDIHQATTLASGRLLGPPLGPSLG